MLRGLAPLKRGCVICPRRISRVSGAFQELSEALQMHFKYFPLKRSHGDALQKARKPREAFSQLQAESHCSHSPKLKLATEHCILYMRLCYKHAECRRCGGLHLDYEGQTMRLGNCVAKWEFPERSPL